MPTASTKDYTTQYDQKQRWWGLLENPLISALQRNCLDYGRVQGLNKVVRAYDYVNTLDVGCGLAENTAVNKGRYIGIDNSFKRLLFARHKHPQHNFICADAGRLPLKDSAFDMVMLIDTSHHLSDQDYAETVKELIRLSRRYIVVSDPIIVENQNALSRIIYQLDRGQNYRKVPHIRKILDQFKELRLVQTAAFATFPGIYVHTAFVLEKLK